jgi:hypothetical protein
LLRAGWSLKKLHKLIMLSAVYQQSSEGAGQCTKGKPIGPGKQVAVAFNRQRLDFEALHDALLFTRENWM